MIIQGTVWFGNPLNWQVVTTLVEKLNEKKDMSNSSITYITNNDFFTGFSIKNHRKRGLDSVRNISIFLTFIK